MTGTNIIAEPIDPAEHDVQIPEGSFATADGVAEIYDDPLAYFGEEWPRDGKSLDDLYAQYRQHTSGMYDLDELMARFGYTHDDTHTWGADCIGYVNPETLDQIYFYPNGWRIIKLGDFIYLDDNVFEKPYYVSVTNGHSEVGFMMDEVQFRRTFNLFTAYYELPYEFDYTAEGLKYEEEYLTIIGFDGDFEF